MTLGQPSVVGSGATSVFHRELDRTYPLLARGSGVWLYDTSGAAYLDGISGGAMVTSLGHGVPEIIEAARCQSNEVSFIYNQQFTSPAQEHLAAELIEIAPPGFSRVRFATGGAEANETALRLARAYHVERGDERRWKVVSPAQAYHGPTMATLALTGRPSLYQPFGPYLYPSFHIPPSTWRLDPTGRTALDKLDALIEREGGDEIAAFFCEPVSAAALPAYSPPAAFWEGLAERRERHGFLICFDEVVTGLGRTGSWFAANWILAKPDIITTSKGLGAGYAPVGAVLCQEHVYDAVAAGSRAFEPGHTWDGAPLSCAVGLAVLAYLREHALIERVASRGPRLLDQLRSALMELEIVGEVRGHGYLLGVDYVDPRDGRSFLPTELGVARRVDTEALSRGLLLYSTQPTSDGYAGDQTLLAPAFVSSDDELERMVELFAETISSVDAFVASALPDAIGVQQ